MTVDLEAEREAAAARRREGKLEARALRVLRNPGRFRSGNPYPSRWSSSREELEKAIEEQWPGEHRAEVREEILEACVELQEQHREDVTHVDPEEWRDQMASKIREHVREQLEADPTLSNREMMNRYPGEVAFGTIGGYAAEVRKELGIDGEAMARRRQEREDTEPEEGKGAQQDPSQRGEGAVAPPEPAPPPSAPEHGDTVEIEDGDVEVTGNVGERSLPLTPTLNGANGRISITRGGRGIVAEKGEDGTWRLTVTTEDAELVDRIAGACYEELFRVEAATG